MPRTRAPLIAIGPLGDVVAGATVTFTDRATGLPVTHWSAESGGSSSTGTTPTDSLGRVPRWIPPNSTGYNAHFDPPSPNPLGYSAQDEPFDVPLSALNIMSATTEHGFETRVTGNTNYRFAIQADGKVKWSPASGATDDLTLSRVNAATMTWDSLAGQDMTLRLNSGDAGRNVILSLRAAGVEKWRLWKQTDDGFAIYDAPNARTAIRIGTDGALSSTANPANAALWQFGPAATWDATAGGAIAATGSKTRLRVGVGVGYSNGVSARGLALDDPPDDDTINGAGGAFTQYEGFTFLSQSPGFNGRGSLVGFNGTIYIEEIFGTVAITSVSGAGTTTVTASGHGLVAGDSVRITGTGLSALDNKNHKVASVSGTQFTINVAPGGTASAGSSRKLAYHEAEPFIGQCYVNSYGAYANAAELNIAPTVASRAAAILTSVVPAQAYSAWDDAAVFGANSSWRDTGVRGYWVANNSGTQKAGTGIFVSTVAASAPWARAFVYNLGAAPNARGTDIICFDGTTGYLGLGWGATTNQTSTIPARITLGLTSALTEPINAADGIQFGWASGVINMWRSAANVLSITDGTTIKAGSSNGLAIGSSTGKLAFYGTFPGIAKPTVTGSRGGNAALASLLTQLAALGLLTDSSTA